MNYLALHSVGVAASCVLLACSPPAEKAADPAVQGPSVAVTEPPLVGAAMRVGGDLQATVTEANGEFRAGPCKIDTPLPQGYPKPTPPGAIDLKTYPGVRRAEVVGAGTPDGGMNSAFWPLFNHIKKHDIAMTSPVEMDYQGLKAGEQKAPSEWSMAFLYRTAELNQPGQEGNVIVRDAPEVTVIAIGMKGDYSMKLVQEGSKQIEAWLAANPGWEPAGNWRSLYYNGPALFYWNKWAEVQLPVRRAPAQPEISK